GASRTATARSRPRESRLDRAGNPRRFPTGEARRAPAPRPRSERAPQRCANPLPTSCFSRIDATRYPSFEVPHSFGGRSPVRGILRAGAELFHLRCKQATFSPIESPVGGGLGVPRGLSAAADMSLV